MRQSHVRTWAALARGEHVALDEATAAELLSVLRASVLDGLPVQDAADLARRILAATPGAPELYGEGGR